MNFPELQKLVGETIEATGAAGPALLEEDSPALGEQGVNADGMYLIGLIGGKEVGKSAMVNALAGTKITEETSHGPGTQTVIAYAHRNQRKELEALLESAAPGKYRIMTHEHDRLARQVLLDLPDIDSRFEEHIQLTRKMLRHMLFPIWIQSVEKYADARPRELLARVAEGNDPRNFLFCLNKTDQLPAGGAERKELRDDFGQRLGRLLGLEQAPRVFLISATNPAEFDFPELSQLLSREKSTQTVAESRRLAESRRQRSILDWLARQDLAGRARRLARLDEEASELLVQRVGVPLLEETIPAILDDRAYRAVMTDDVFSRRVSHWPIVNMLHGAMTPLRFLIRQNSAASFFGGAEALVNTNLSASNPSIATRVQSVFAQLHQSNPAVTALYKDRRPWESMDSGTAESRLRRDLIETIDRQRESVLARAGGRRGVIAPVIRFLLTIGALLWFPFVQPVLHTALSAGLNLSTVKNVGLLVVDLLSTTSLLTNGVFLLFWYLTIWILIRWDTRRRVDHLLARWKTADQPDPSLNLTARGMAWVDDLLQEIRQTRRKMEGLAERIEIAQGDLKDSANIAA